MMIEAEHALNTEDGDKMHQQEYASPRYDDSFEGISEQESWEVPDARPILPKAAFFMGDLRDGLPMLNMQAAFLISAKDFSEKQMGVLFLAFGLSQFLCMTPAGYFLDYANNKINWVNWACIGTSTLTVLTTITAKDGGENMGLMIILKILQGGITAILPPGFNGITLGIVGSTGFTHQVSRNRMMNHIGTALVVAIGSLIAYLLYPNIGALFIVSPLATIGTYYNLVRIKPNHVDRDAARCLIIESPTMTEYEHIDERSCITALAEDSDESNESSGVSSCEESNIPTHVVKEESEYVPPDIAKHHLNETATGKKLFSTNEHTPNPELQPPSAGNSHPIQPNHFDSIRQDWPAPQPTNHVRSYGSGPSFNFGWGRNRKEQQTNTESSDDCQDMTPRRARTPFSVLLDSTFVTFTVIVFFFHLANSSVLPLVMQSLALQDPQAGILLSGLCILIGQAFMSYFAKICGDYSPKWGRKGLIILALASLTVRCFVLTILLSAQGSAIDESESNIIKTLILSTQILDSVGAGIFGTMHILVTNDISCKTGRFSLMLGVTTGAMCLGATVSGYIGQAIAQDHGYPVAFTFLGILSLVPLFMYVFCMPETLPDYAKPKQRRRRLMAILKKLNEHRRKLTMKANLFRRRKRNSEHSMEEMLANESDGTPNTSHANLELV